METGLLHLHNALRWVVLLLLLLSIVQAFSKKESVRSTSLFLMIAAHTMLLIGLYQVLGGRYSWANVPEGVSVMKDSFYRFYLVEHPLLMILAVVLITWARTKAKILSYKPASYALLVSLLMILAAMPWPFREVVGRPWFPGM
jgi:chromate transport protein ChrA